MPGGEVVENRCCQVWGSGAQALNMENENSKIPVYSFQHPKVIGMPKDTQMSLHSKKQCLKKSTDLEPLKVPDFAFGENVHVRGALKDTNQRLMKTAKKATLPPPKKAAIAIAQSPMNNRYRREAELRKKNKLLESAKCELSLKLMEMQKDMKEMKEQFDSLEQENQKLKKFQERCMLILETRNCGPVQSVTDDNILEEKEENKKTQTEITDLTEKLNTDLELFIQMAREQKENLQKTQIKWKQVEEEQAHFLEQQQSFHREMEDLFAILDQEDNLLNSS
ncbi:small kinetochore-associated protein-like isoform X5 [Rhineura floridana]|uniref:small kinetochore-associated protein-like isoform X5 n=1 Tax=Rhineura floridana TaxID=261503 RepID=UPI002AC866B5|nr:small kinetochore-associated protein-like isoform X5 [Rhineura floridana]